MTEVKRLVFGMCREGWHDTCIGGYREVTTTGGVVLPAVECACDCGHEAQREREVNSGD